MFHRLSQSCQEIRPPHCDNAAKTSKLTQFFVFCEHQWAFLAPIWHKTCGSQDFLWQFHTKPFDKFEGIPVKVQRQWIDVAREPLCQRVAQRRQSLEMAVLDPLIMHVCSSIAKFSAPLPNTFVTHKVWSIHCTHSAMNFSCAMAFSLQKNGSLSESRTCREFL